MKLPYPLKGVTRSGIYGVRWKQVAQDLWSEINKHNIFNGAAALAYYFFLAIFPAMLALLSLLPYLHIPNLQESIMGFLGQSLPGDAAKLFTSTVQEIVAKRMGGLLSLSLILAFWAASTGVYGTMQQLNISYEVSEDRSFLKSRATAMALTLLFGGLLISAFTMIVVGGLLQRWLVASIGGGKFVDLAFSIGRWTTIIIGILAAFSVIYYYGPNVKQRFRFVTPGSLLSAILLVAVSLGFKFYVEKFGDFNATYGSIGTVIVLLLWLNFMGLVTLLGSEINSLIEHYSPEGKDKGEKELPPEVA